MIDVSKLIDYPIWVKIIAAIWLLSSFVILGVLLFLKPNQDKVTTIAPASESTPKTKTESELKQKRTITTENNKDEGGAISIKGNVSEIYFNGGSITGKVEIKDGPKNIHFNETTIKK